MGGGGSKESDVDHSEDEANAKHPDNVKCEHEGWDDIRDKKRGCTDSLCILIIVAVWVAMTGVGLVVTGVIDDDHLQKGNPNRLIYPMDYDGNICGIDSKYKDRPFGYYLPDQTAVCVKKCPNKFDPMAFICRYTLQEEVDLADDNGLTGYEAMSEGACMYEIDTINFLQRCIPDLGVGKGESAATVVANAKAQNVSVTDSPYEAYAGEGAGLVTKSIGDVVQLRAYIFGFGLGVSVLVAFLYLYVLRIPGLLFTVIWSIITAIFILLLVGSWLLWGLASTWRNDGLHSKGEAEAMKVCAYIGMAITVAYFCMIVVLRKRIQLAIGIVKQACKAMGAMPAIILIPLVQAIGLILFLSVWVIYTLYLASSGEMKRHSGKIENADGTTTDTLPSTTFTYTDNTKYAFLYMLFCWFWTSEFVVAIGQLVVALSFVAWYFTRDKSKIGNTTVVWSFKTILRYHLGTAAYGSLIIAIIKTIKAVAEYIKRKAMKTKNTVLIWIMCLVQCFLTCLEKIMKFLNKHAYILVAIYGYSFCSACRKAFFLLLRNILRVAAVNMIAAMLLLLGKIFVPVVTTFLCYVSIVYQGNGNDDISGIIAPLFFCFMFAYFVSAMFSELFGMGIETILFCFIADEEMFAVENRFASGELMTTMQKTAQAAASKKVHAEEVLEKEAEEKKAAAGGGDPVTMEVQIKPAGEVLL